MSLELNRKSGILLHITSLPGPHGIGDLGQAAYSFVDSMHEMGQRLWQILPTNPPENLYYSPYSATSAFAGNVLMISLELLQEDGLIKDNEIENFPRCSKNYVEFDKVNFSRKALLKKAAQRFQIKATEDKVKDFNNFCNKNQSWLDYFSLYTYLSEKYNFINWTKWEYPLRSFDPKVVQEYLTKYKAEISQIKILQYFFYIQWQDLKVYAKNKGINIIGDIPIYVAHESADVWANQELFKLDQDGCMIVQSGCPPDLFQETGQLWGHPIYNWDIHEKTEFSWWLSRIEYLFRMVDIIRIDHFNGLVKYWEVPAEDRNAVNGAWIQAPGEKLLEKMIKELGKKPIMAENLGEAASDSEPLLKKFGIPGMQIVQISIDNGNTLADIDTNNVIYTGTHDNDTALGWFKNKVSNSAHDKKGDSELKKDTLSLIKSDGYEIHWDMTRLALDSSADIAIIPLQDILGLDSQSRMNMPGTVGKNWEWRFDPDLLTSEIKKKLLNMTVAAGRV